MEEPTPFAMGWLGLWLFAFLATLVSNKDFVMLYYVGFVLVPSVLLLATGFDLSEVWLELSDPKEALLKITWGLALGFILFFYFSGALWQNTAIGISNVVGSISPSFAVDSDLDGMPDIFDIAPENKRLNIAVPMATAQQISGFFVASLPIPLQILGTFFIQIFVVGFAEEYAIRVGLLSILKKALRSSILALLVASFGFSLLHYAIYPSVLGAYVAAFMGGIFFSFVYLIVGFWTGAIAHGVYNSLIIVSSMVGIKAFFGSGIPILIGLVLAIAIVYLFAVFFKKQIEQVG